MLHCQLKFEKASIISLRLTKLSSNHAPLVMREFQTVVADTQNARLPRSVCVSRAAEDINSNVWLL